MGYDTLAWSMAPLLDRLELVARSDWLIRVRKHSTLQRKRTKLRRISYWAVDWREFTVHISEICSHFYTEECLHLSISNEYKYKIKIIFYQIVKQLVFLFDQSYPMNNTIEMTHVRYVICANELIFNKSNEPFCFEHVSHADTKFHFYISRLLLFFVECAWTFQGLKTFNKREVTK